MSISNPMVSMMILHCRNVKRARRRPLQFMVQKMRISVPFIEKALKIINTQK